MVILTMYAKLIPCLFLTLAQVSYDRRQNQIVATPVLEGSLPFLSLWTDFKNLTLLRLSKT